MFQIKYRSEKQFVVFYLAFCKSYQPETGLFRSVVVCSLGYSPTVDTENRVNRLQPDVNSPGSCSGLVSISMGSN